MRLDLSPEAQLGLETAIAAPRGRAEGRRGGGSGESEGLILVHNLPFTNHTTFDGSPSFSSLQSLHSCFICTIIFFKNIIHGSHIYSYKDQIKSKTFLNNKGEGRDGPEPCLSRWSLTPCKEVAPGASLLYP